jgi:hypothetical protein
MAVSIVCLGRPLSQAPSIMPKLNLDPITAQDLAEYLAETSDFSFELRTLRMLRAQGLLCDHGGLYEDPVTKKSRQFDIRAIARDGQHCVRLAIECKNISEHFPLLVSCILPHPDESFHEIAVVGEIEDGQHAHGLYESRAHVFRLREASSIYRPRAPVGKTIAQVGREANKERTVYASGQDVFEKWAQCLASADELVRISYSEGADDFPSISYVTVLPIVVVPDARLWTVEYDNDGDLKSGPIQTDQCSLFVNHAYDLGIGQPTFRISHIEFVTLTGLRILVSDSLKDRAAMETIFPTGLIEGYLEELRAGH